MTPTDLLDVEEPRPAQVAIAPTPAPPRGPARSRADVAVIMGLALALWLGVIYLGRTWGLLLELQGRQLVLFTPPILGGYRDAVPLPLLLTIPVAIAGVWLLPRWSRRLGWNGVCAVGVLAGLAWGVALALIDGIGGLLDGLEWDREYAPVVAQIRAAGVVRWLHAFTASVPTAGVQVRAHPPGMPLFLALLDGLGLRGAGWAAAAIIAAAVSSIVAVLLVVREVCGEDIARRAMPFVALAPAVVFIFTSFDALYMAVSAWFVAALVFAARREGRRSDHLAMAAGVLAAAAAMGSYGMVLMGLVPLAVAIRARAWRPPVLAAATAATGLLAFVPFGFWWPSGLAATHTAYYALGLDRPYYYFALNTFSALALVVGPAVAVGLAVGRNRSLWMLVGGALAAIIVANLTGLSTGEVERIWLPFALWLLPACAVLVRSDRSARVWLSLQVACPIVLLALIRPLW